MLFKTSEERISARKALFAKIDIAGSGFISFDAEANSTKQGNLTAVDAGSTQQQHLQRMAVRPSCLEG